MNEADIPHLVALLRQTADRLARESIWKRLSEWEAAPTLGIRFTSDEPCDEDEDGNPPPRTTSVMTEQDRLEDARCARWFAEYRDILGNLHAPLRRVLRLHDMAAVEDRHKRWEDGTFDPMLAQEAAHAGYCASCWRLDQQLVEIETDRNGHRYYRDWCRACGSFKAEHGMLPPMDLLRIRQRRQWTTADITASLTKATARRGRKAS